MQTKSKLMFAVLAALAMGASSAFARGHDDLAPPPACDDQAIDGFCGPNALNEGGLVIAKQGADDVLPEPLDNNGVDFIIGRNGADDLVPEGLDNNGVDVIPG